MYCFFYSQLRTYSISTIEVMRNRDYVLHCDDKYEVEFEYDEFLLTSEIIICLGSLVFFAFVGFKLCSVKGDTAGKMVSRIRSWFGRCRCGNVEEAVSGDGLPEQQSDNASLNQNTSVSESDSRSKLRIKVSAIQTYKKRISVIMIINLATVFSLIIDTTILFQNKDVVKDTFPYAYGIVNLILLVLAFISILAKISIFVVFIIIYCKDRIKRRRTKSRDYDKNNVVFSRILDVKHCTHNCSILIHPITRICHSSGFRHLPTRRRAGLVGHWFWRGCISVRYMGCSSHHCG